MKRTQPDLRVRWSKRESDIEYHSPRRPDGHLLHAYFSGNGVKDNHEQPISLIEELERRGYDRTTLRFSVRKKERRDFVCSRCGQSVPHYWHAGPRDPSGDSFTVYVADPHDCKPPDPVNIRVGP